jgi:hypothetical protein
MIKDIMSFAKCETEKMSCDYVEAIHSSRHTLWPIWLHILNVNKDKKNFIKEERREWIDMDFQRKLIEDTKSNEDHDSDWRRINRGLVAMNHTSEKSKWKTWRRGTGCDEEGKVNSWVQDINHAMKTYKALSVDICWIKKSRRHGQEETSWLHKSKKFIISGSRQSCSS